MVALATAFVRLAAQPDRVSFIREGQKMGDLAGDSAGRNMGSRMVAGASAEFKRGEGRLVKDGDGIGDNVGRAMSRAVGRGSQKASGDTSAFGSALALTAARATLFGTTMAAALPSVIHLTAALAPAAGAVTVLPAALLAGAAAAGTFKVATSGVADAIGKGLTGTAKQAKVELDKLPPSARAFATSIIDLKPRLDALRASVAQHFFKPLQDEITPLANRLLPLLKRQMTDLAGPLGGLGEQVAQSARKMATMQAVATVFHSARLSAIELRPAIDPLIRAFSLLASTTAGQLPGLASGFAVLAQRVGAFITQASLSGRVVAAFRAAMVVLRDLGAIAGNVGSILLSVFRAASQGSGSLLGNLRALTGQVAAFLRSAQGSAALTAFFGTLSTLGAALRTSLAAVLPAVARSLQIIGPVLAGLAGPAAQLVVALAPLLPYFTSLAAIVLRAVTPAIASLAGWLAQNGTTLKIVASALAAGIAAFRVISVVTRVWAAAQTVLNVVLAANPIGIVVIALAALVAGLVIAYRNSETFRNIVNGAWNSIKSVVGSVGAWFTGTLFPSIRTAIAQGAAAWGVLRGAVLAAWNGVKSVVTTVGAAIGTVFRGIGTVVTWLYQTIFAPYFKAIGYVVHAAWVVIQIAAAAIRLEFVYIGKVAQALYQTYILPTFRAIGAVVRALYTATVQPVVNLIKAAWNIMAAAIRAVWTGIILPVFRTFVGTAVSVGNTLRGVFATIRTFFATLGAGIRAVWTGIIWPVFSALITGVRDKVAGAFRTAVSAITAAWNKVKEAARLPVAFVVNSVIRPFVIGINNAAGFFGVKDRISVPAKMAHGGLLPAHAQGGRISGMPSTTDNRLAPASIPGVGAVKLAGGEFIVNARDTAKALPILSWINDGMKGGPREAAKRIGRPPIDPMGDGSEGWAFAGGGLVGWIKNAWGAVKNLGTKIWDIASDPIALIKKPFEAAMRGIPGAGGILDLLTGAGHRVIDWALKWIKGAGGGATGSAGAAQAFVRAQAGKPYVWNAAGPGGYDCCIIAGVRVYGPDGAKSIEDIRAGDRVFSYVNGRMETHRVVKAWQSIRQPVYAVRTRNRTVTASANHPFLRIVGLGKQQVPHHEDAHWPGLPTERAPYGSRRTAICTVSTCPDKVHAKGLCSKHLARYNNHGDPLIWNTTRETFGTEWSRLDQLKRGDLLVQPRLMSTDSKPHAQLPDGTPVDTDVAWLIGAMVGDGTVTDRGVRLCLYGDRRDRATTILTERWGVHPTHGDAYGLVATKANLARALSALGMKVAGPDKRIPETVWTWEPALQRAFLNGYCDADGHRPANRQKHGDRTYASASRDLIEDVRALHMMLGDPVSNISTNRRTKPIVIRGREVKNAKPLHTFTVWASKSSYGEARLRNNPDLGRWLDEGDFTATTVLAIDPQGEQDTYDLNIEDAHNFVADGVVVHNSGIVSAVYNVLRGKSPYNHTFSTGSLPGRWFRPGVGGSPLLAGWSHPGQSPASSSTGHMAGQITGLPFESRGSRGVVVGGGARRIGAFANLGHAVFAKGGLFGDGIRLFDSGGLWPTGTLGANLSGKTEYVSTERGGTVVEFHAHFHGPVASERAAEDMVYGAWKRLKRDKKIP